MSISSTTIDFFKNGLDIIDIKDCYKSLISDISKQQTSRKIATCAYKILNCLGFSFTTLSEYKGLLITQKEAKVIEGLATNYKNATDAYRESFTRIDKANEEERKAYQAALKKGCTPNSAVPWVQGPLTATPEVKGGIRWVPYEHPHDYHKTVNLQLTKGSSGHWEIDPVQCPFEGWITPLAY